MIVVVAILAVALIVVIGTWIADRRSRANIISFEAAKKDVEAGILTRATKEKLAIDLNVARETVDAKKKSDKELENEINS